ncbi:arabinan endo-1,5-alpha-L-arabinosidase [Microbispora triticiradicis]|uniref:Arabinan endo-1,5-alpha-L-arabinosidase n=3 Tax=Microbispora TaxID=2005 RepID=A0A5R8Z570_9ACTN|nr:MULTISPECIES: family 43 glycosylhydrolase [Microbispora]RGA01876.1 arabinan endo-1,5-alpha-L-arabinosidase [Microbispora triticiradicis]TLP60932.1 arabinan endo-1,5-alpha-L-arabinosidase [Microbispora fusca]
MNARSPWRGALASALTLLLALGLGLVLTGPARAATIDTNASYVLVNRNSGKVLDVYNWATNDGAPLVQYSRNDGAWQQWQFVDSGGGYYRLKSRHSGKVVDISGRSTADGADVIQYADKNATNQQFRVVDTDSGYVKLINRNSGKALEVWEWSTADAGRISQYTDLNGANQQWQLVKLVAYPDPGYVTGDVGAHDPEVTKKPDGSYLLAYTGDNIALKTSTDRTAWRNAGVAFPGGASWTHAYTNGSNTLWAPDITYLNGRYYMYYAASTFGSNHSGIFLATSTTGASGSWTNQGLVIESNTSDNWNAIDPNLVVDDQGRWWLDFGSFWSGIKMVQLDPATGKRLNNTVLSISGRNGGATEAPFIYRHGGYYYQFVSFDLCCKGASSTYRIMVGRSASVTGPYVDRNGTAMTSGGGTQVLAGHGSIHGPGHQAVLADNDGDILFYHWYADDGSSRLGINKLGWDSAGWPYVY